MNDINSILNKLLEYYDIDTMAELSEILKVSQPTISKWKARNTIIPIKRKCKELGIYNEIFGDLNQNSVIQDITNYGNNAGINNGSINSNIKKIDKDIFDDDILTLLKSISPIIENNKSKKDSFKKNLKLWLVENI